VDAVGLHVGTALADAAAVQEPDQVGAPGGVLDDALNDQFVARSGERGQTPVESGEEPGVHLGLPGERAIWVAAGGEHAASEEGNLHQMKPAAQHGTAGSARASGGRCH